MKTVEDYTKKVERNGFKEFKDTNLVLEEKPRLTHSPNVKSFHFDNQRKIFHDFTERETIVRRQITSY